MGNVVNDQILEWQDAIHGALELENISQAEFSDGSSAEFLFNARQEPIGAKFSRAQISISFTERITVDEQVDWFRLKEERRPALLTRTFVGSDLEEGDRYTYNCYIASVSTSGDNAGEQTRTISIVAARQRKQR